MTPEQIIKELRKAEPDFVQYVNTHCLSDLLAAAANMIEELQKKCKSLEEDVAVYEERDERLRDDAYEEALRITALPTDKDHFGFWPLESHIADVISDYKREIANLEQKIKALGEKPK